MRKGRGNRDEPDPPVAEFLSGGAWSHAPELFTQPPEVLPCNFWSFRDYCVNFELINVIFIYLFEFVFDFVFVFVL